MLYDLTPDRTTRCADGPQPGAVALLETLLRNHPRSRSLGIYNCRPIRGSTSLSRHAGGSAPDWDPGDNSDPDGYAVADALVLRARDLGVQRIIWDGRIWEHADGWQPYGGTAGPHRDHLHIELTDEAAAGLTMGYVVGVFGLPRAPRKDPAVPTPKPTDLVAYLGLPRTADSAGGVIALQRDGGIVTISGKPRILGSMHSVGMRPHTRTSSGIFVGLAAGPKPGEYVIVDSQRRSYTFTRSLAESLAAAE